jgi:curved DNA-binding protein CbpA
VPRVRTHYDNLKVSRDAPIEVIQAAFTSLAAKYCPNGKPDNDSAARIMQIVDRSYSVVSNPRRRAEHDRWIVSVEQRPSQSQHTHPDGDLNVASGPKFAQVDVERHFGGWFITVAIGLLVCIFLGALFLVSRSGSSNQPASNHKESEAPLFAPKPQIPERPRYIRPASAPDGKPWPTTSAYLLDHGTEGENYVVVDNTQNSSDMLVKVKLFDRQLKRQVAVRTFFLKAGERFTTKGLRPGDYDICYQDLDSGVISRSPRAPGSFSLKSTEEEMTDPDGTVHPAIHLKNFSLTLYKVLNGNTDSEVIRPDEF